MGSKLTLQRVVDSKALCLQVFVCVCAPFHVQAGWIVATSFEGRSSWMPASGAKCNRSPAALLALPHAGQGVHLRRLRL